MQTIGKVAKASGCKVQTIRYYEKIGLIQAAVRNQGNQRLYRDGDIERLQFIRHARGLGFSTDVIKDLLQLDSHQQMSCLQVDTIAREQLELVKRRISQLQSLASELNNMLEQCQGENIANCKIMLSLHDHSHCDNHNPMTLNGEAPHQN